MSDLQALEDWAGVLLQRLEPSARTALARKIAQQLRRTQQQRITAQRNPDDSPYAARKSRDLRGKQGRIQRKLKMFRKLRNASYLKAKGDSNLVSVGFTGRISRIARVHQYGLKDRAERGAPEVKYEQREVLGFTDADLDLIRDMLLNQLTQ
ncbi:phage virion morphogenesis protein [Pseudomonas putida]|uniref:Phage virion morphogenesis protein n=1 Tax=Pseudomonas putida TaxID=303 RepID=A0A2Z4RSX2_PSEPU|nr:phage virion morphogenesis protein [Pseudomonas putida]AWY43745.1 phage virion morphogenesis protein [Pseudomonas putida]